VVAHPTRLGCASASRTKWRRLTDLFGKKLRSFGSLGLTVPALLQISRLALAKSFRTLEWVAIPHSKRRGSAAVVKRQIVQLFSSSLSVPPRLIRNNGTHSLQNAVSLRLGNIWNLRPAFVLNLFVPRGLCCRRFFSGLFWHTNFSHGL
jgi:hypothetical protein